MCVCVFVFHWEFKVTGYGTNLWKVEKSQLMNQHCIKEKIKRKKSFSHLCLCHWSSVETSNILITLL